MKLDDYPDVMTIAQVREVLNIGSNLAYDLLNSGTLPGFKLGWKHRVYKEDLRRFLENASGTRTPA